MTRFTERDFDLLQRRTAKASASGKPRARIKPARMTAEDWLKQTVLEREFQRQAVKYFRGVIRPPCMVMAVVNQRTIGRLRKKVQHQILAALIADGMIVGASDLQFWWDARLGTPGNRGVAEAELKRPSGANAASEEQLAYIAAKRAMGHVAGVALSLEAIEDVLVEAGAPLMARLPRRGPSLTAEQITATGWSL